jgi:hypothetical protein
LHLASIDVRLYSEMIIVGFLPETPISFITASVVMVAVAAAFAGIEVIGRVADIIFPLFWPCCYSVSGLSFGSPILQPAARPGPGL